MCKCTLIVLNCVFMSLLSVLIFIYSKAALQQCSLVKSAIEIDLNLIEGDNKSHFET